MMFTNVLMQRTSLGAMWWVFLLFFISPSPHSRYFELCQCLTSSCSSLPPLDHLPRPYSRGCMSTPPLPKDAYVHTVPGRLYDHMFIQSHTRALLQRSVQGTLRFYRERVVSMSVSMAAGRVILKSPLEILLELLVLEYCRPPGKVSDIKFVALLWKFPRTAVWYNSYDA